MRKRVKTKKPKVVTSIKTKNGYRQITLGRFIMGPSSAEYVLPRRWQEGLDYRRSNLIVCTIAERQQILGKIKSSRNSSLYKGVTRVKAANPWRARIHVEGKTILIGNYSSEAEAAEAYNHAARKYFGEKAYQNRVVEPFQRRKR